MFDVLIRTNTERVMRFHKRVWDKLYLQVLVEQLIEEGYNYLIIHRR